MQKKYSQRFRRYKEKSIHLPIRRIFETFLSDIYKASKSTISAYSDSFTIFFMFLQNEKGLPITLLPINI